MKIEVYLDGAKTALKVLSPPEKLVFDSQALSDGWHSLTFKTVNDAGQLLSQREIPFQVQNGPSISVHGLAKNDIVSGELPILVNAYHSEIGDEFEPEQIESPTPIPTWAWVLVLLVVMAAAGFLSISLHQPRLGDLSAVQTSNSSSKVMPSSHDLSSLNKVSNLGATIYGNNCSSCHQIDGQGLSGVFPPLVANPAVLNDDPSEHILAVLEGVQGKVIEGVAYATPMPAFAAVLSDEEIAAVVNHERTQWGNSASIVDAQTVKKLRKIGKLK